MGALLRAAESQLLEKSFADVSVTSIVNEAGSSSGSFYARFRDKRALLHALHERVVERGVVRAQELVSELGDQKLSVTGLSTALVDSLVGVFFADRGVIRAVLIESLKDAAFAERASDFVTRISKLAASSMDTPNLSSKRVTAELEVGVLTVMAILEQDLFFSSALSTVQSSNGQISKRDHQRLRRVFLASMTLE